jgi:hypothetical protein
MGWADVCDGTFLVRLVMCRRGADMPRIATKSEIKVQAILRIGTKNVGVDSFQGDTGMSRWPFHATNLLW